MHSGAFPSPNLAALVPAGQNRRTRVYLCSGYGAQTPDIGKVLYDAVPEFARLVDALNLRLRFLCGKDVLTSLWRDEPLASLEDPEHAHPTIFIVQYALGRYLTTLLGPPDLILAASLGELVAAALSGAIDLDDALRLVSGHGEIFSRHGVDGGMLAVLAAPGILDVLHDADGAVELVTVAARTHFVVAGPTKALARAEAAFEALGVQVIRLAVNRPFHTRAIEPLRTRLSALDGAVSLRAPRCPVLSCATADWVIRYTGEHLWRVVRDRMLLQETLARLADVPQADIIDIGPASSLIGLVTEPRADARLYRVLSNFRDDHANVVRLRREVAQPKGVLA